MSLQISPSINKIFSTKNSIHSTSNLLEYLIPDKPILEPITFLDMQFIETNSSEVEVSLTTINPDKTFEIKNQRFNPAHLLDYIILDKPIVFFDFETTGLEGNDTRVTEFSFVKLYPDRNVEIWIQRINPEMPIPEFITKFTGISDDDVKGCPTFSEIANGVHDFLSDSHLSGYNIMLFDLPLLEIESQKAGVNFTTDGRAVIDPKRIYHRFVSAKVGEKRSLADGYKLYCNKELLRAHASVVDTLAAIEILSGQLEHYKNELPKDIYKLSDYCANKLPEYVDFLGKLVWRKNKEGAWEIVCNYPGPEHRGDLLVSVIKNDMKYINWMLEPKVLDFSDEVKNIIRDAVKGIYPKSPD